MTPSRRRGLQRLLGLASATFAVMILAIGQGSTEIPWLDVFRALSTDDGSVQTSIVRDARLPRVLAAFSVGALLGMAGALMQVLVRNPLADPYVMGTAGGAAAAFLLAALWGVSPAFQTAAAFSGALASMAMVAWLSRISSGVETMRLLLTGVMLAAGWGALVALMLSVAPSTRIPGLLFWLLGDLDNLLAWPTAALTLTVGLVLAFAMARPLNLLALGGLGAASLGVAIGRLQSSVFVLASLLTAVAVTVAGPIGFVGLVAPHLVRLTVATDHRLLIPGAALCGGALLVLADLLARTLIAPVKIPVGVVTALIGVPLFLALLARDGRFHGR